MVATLAYRDISRTSISKQSVLFPPIIELATLLGILIKWGYLRVLDHLYMLTLFALIALHLVLLFRFESFTRIWEKFIGK